MASITEEQKTKLMLDVCTGVAATFFRGVDPDNIHADSVFEMSVALSDQLMPAETAYYKGKFGDTHDEAEEYIDDFAKVIQCELSRLTSVSDTDCGIIASEVFDNFLMEQGDA